MPETALFDLMSWMSPAWPIGGFAHSSGLEWAVEEGFVTDRESTAEWLAALVEDGPLHNDLVLFVHAWRAARDGDEPRLREVAELAVASQTGFERRLETTAQGAAFRRIAVATIPPRNGEGDHAKHGGGAPDLGAALEEHPLHHAASRRGPPPRSGEDFATLVASVDDGELTYPVAAATLFASRGIALRPALTAWLHGAVSNLVSAAQRLVPLGQTDGQLVLRDLRPAVLEAVESAQALPDGDPFEAMGGAALLAELGCMAHETQYTRLFRT